MEQIIYFGLPLSVLASFALASILIELTPGPNMTYLAIVAAGKGKSFGFATVVGVALGLAIIGLGAAFGITAMINSSAVLYELLRWSGIAFLLFLAWEGWRGEGAKDEADRGKALSKWTYFKRGLLTNLLNPKAAAFYVTVLPGFLPLEAALSQSLLLTAIYVAAATIIHFLIVVLAGSLAPFLTDPRREEIARRILSLLLAGVAVWFAFGTAR